MPAPKKKMRRRLSIVDVVVRFQSDLFDKISGIFGMLHEIKNRLPSPAMNAASPRPDRVSDKIPVAEWLIAEPELPPVMHPPGRLRRGGNELAAVLIEIAHRAETLHETGRLAEIKYDERKGEIQLWAREWLR